jgi:hypothetical protein
VGEPPLVVRIESLSPVIGEAEFLAALFRTLRRPIVSATSGAPPGEAELSIRYDAPRRELVVTCYDKSRGAVTRVVEPPSDARDVPETAALLAENLCTAQVDAPSPVAPAPSPVVVVPVPMVPLGPTPATAPPPRPHAPAVVGVFYPLSSNYEQPELRTNFEFNLLYGRVGELDGVGIGMVNAVEADASGFVAAALGNRAGGRASGLHAAGVFNSALRLDEGVMLAFLLNHANEDVHGGQGTLGLNLAGPVHGAQLAGFMNVSRGPVEGAQVAVGGNVAREFQGFQAASVVNVARDLDGVQLGLVNVAGRVRGAQIGLVNIADDVDGVPLGLVNVTRSGGVHALAWGGYTTLANVGLKFSTRYTYSMFTLGYHREDEVNAFGPGFVFGVRVPVESGISVAFDVGGDYLFGTRFCCYEDKTAERVAHTKDRNHFRLRVLPSWQLKPRFAIFAGGGVALEVPFARYSDLDGYDQSVRLVPDFAAGIEL